MLMYIFAPLSVSLGMSFLVYLMMKYWSSLRGRRDFLRGPARGASHGGLLIGLLHHLKVARLHYSKDVFNIATTSTISDVCCWAILLVLNSPYSLTFLQRSAQETAPSTALTQVQDSRFHTGHQAPPTCSNVTMEDIAVQFLFVFMTFLANIFRYNVMVRLVRAFDSAANGDTGDELTDNQMALGGLKYSTAASKEDNRTAVAWYYAIIAAVVASFLWYLTMYVLPAHDIDSSICIEQTQVFLPASSFKLLSIIFLLSYTVPLVVCYSTYPCNEVNNQQRALVEAGEGWRCPENVHPGVTESPRDCLVKPSCVNQTRRRKCRRVFSRSALIYFFGCLPSLSVLMICSFAAASTSQLHLVLHAYLCTKHIVLIGVCSTAWNFFIIT